MTIIHDDTSVWLAQEKNELKADKPEGAHEDDSKKKAGRKKTQSLLGLLQRVFLRRTGDDGQPFGETVELHAPAQLLPKANAYTVRDRLLKWAVYSSSGCCLAPRGCCGGSDL